MKTAKTWLTIVAVAVGAIGYAGSAMAHHSFVAEYDGKQPITLTGKLSKMEWVNPHGWLYVDVKDATGKTETWAAESGSPNALLRRGLRKTDFPIGSDLVLKGYRAKNGTPTINAITVTFGDGRSFYLGSSGTGAPEPAN